MKGMVIGCYWMEIYTYIVGGISKPPDLVAGTSMIDYFIDRCAQMFLFFSNNISHKEQELPYLGCELLTCRRPGMFIRHLQTPPARDVQQTVPR